MIIQREKSKTLLSGLDHVGTIQAQDAGSVRMGVVNHFTGFEDHGMSSGNTARRFAADDVEAVDTRGVGKNPVGIGEAPREFETVFPPYGVEQLKPVLFGSIDMVDHFQGNARDRGDTGKEAVAVNAGGREAGL